MAELLFYVLLADINRRDSKIYFKKKKKIDGGDIQTSNVILETIYKTECVCVCVCVFRGTIKFASVADTSTSIFCFFLL